MRRHDLQPRQREDLIRRYEEGPASCAPPWRRVPPEAMQWRPAEGKWSAHEVAIHSADSETNAAAAHPLSGDRARIRSSTATTRRDWARKLDYHALPDRAGARRPWRPFAPTPRALLRRLPEKPGRNEGRHTQSGKFSGERWLRSTPSTSRSTGPDRSEPGGLEREPEPRLGSAGGERGLAGRTISRPTRSDSSSRASRSSSRVRKFVIDDAHRGAALQDRGREEERSPLADQAVDDRRLIRSSASSERCGPRGG